MTWADAMMSYKIGRDLTSYGWHVKILDKYCNGKFLDELKNVRDQIVKDRLSQGIKKHTKHGVSPSSVNKTLAFFRSIMRHAQKKGWVDSVNIELLPEGTGRIRWITREEADRLIDALPEHLKDPVIFALETGLRQENVVGLEWSRVDLERRVCWVEAEDHKNGEPHVVPLSSAAVVVLRRRQGRHKQWVFAYRDRKLWRINNNGWREALKRAGITNFRVHDLRHTWASWHVQNGTPLPVLQKLGGWKTLAMVLRYGHLGQSHVQEWADNISWSKHAREHETRVRATGDFNPNVSRLVGNA